MNYARVGAVVVAGLAVLSCQTITEELPATAVLPPSVPVPIVVIQLPQAQPQSPPPSSPTSAPSNGTPSGGGPTQPQPQQPQPTNPPTSGGGGCTGWPANCNPVASIHAHVYYLQCNGVAVDGKYSTEGPWDCDVVLDATAKDDKGKHTQAKGSPEWSISGGYTLVTSGNPYTPKILGGRTGEATFSVTIDGVQSNVTTYRFR